MTEAWLESFEGRRTRLVTRMTGDGVLPATGRALFITVPREHVEQGTAGTPSVPTVAP